MSGSIYCERPLAVVGSCIGHGDQKDFRTGCYTCEPCVAWRKMDLYRRFERTLIPYHPRVFDNNRIEMWTFGTNWELDKLPDLRDCWRKFQVRLRRYIAYHGWEIKFKVYFRAYEVGKSGILHVHALIHRDAHWQKNIFKGVEIFGLQPLYRKIWSDVTGLKRPNVNYSYRPEYSASSAFAYSTKYLGKSMTDFGKFAKDQGVRTHYIAKPLWNRKTKSELLCGCEEPLFWSIGPLEIPHAEEKLIKVKEDIEYRNKIRRQKQRSLDSFT